MFTKIASYGKFFGRIRGVSKIMKEVDDAPNVLVPDEFEALIQETPNKIAFLFEDETWTFSAFNARANQVADWAIRLNLVPGDTVGLVMENCPDFIAIWLGLSKVGVVTALVNTNLEGAGLAHCVNIVDAKAIIARGEQAKHANAILSELNDETPLWDVDGVYGASFEEALTTCSESNPSRSHRANLGGHDTCLYIYTSGTTGLPKAAKITHQRLRRAMRMSKILGEVSSEDIVYNCLPLYHITGGGLGVGTVLYAGATMHIRQKFSASEFWKDVCRTDATVFVYIGELCRYLLNAPPDPLETQHRLRVGVGNGLRGDVWQSFVDRFEVSTMRELYGSTEGNVTFLNLDGKVGAVGQSPPLFDRRTGVAFVKFDVETEEPVRGVKGFCEKCGPGEIGEVLGRIEEDGRSQFTGYQDKAATRKKILTDVFKADDKWFRTGDLMKRDALGYVYFVDRIGDTFRWKGENVATNEVADTLSKFSGIELANVYGVSIPNTDGRAGMASVTVTHELDYRELAEFVLSNLPAYAVPVFVRQVREADTTGTFKFRKVDAVKEGFDPLLIDDPLWVLDHKERTYQRLTQTGYDAIISGEMRL